MANYCNFKKFNGNDYGELIEENKFQSGYWSHNSPDYGIVCDEKSLRMNFYSKKYKQIQLECFKTDLYFYSFIKGNTLFVNYDKNKMRVGFYNDEKEKYECVYIEDDGLVTIKNKNDEKETKIIDLYMPHKIDYVYEELYKFKYSHDQDDVYIYKDENGNKVKIIYDDGNYGFSYNKNDHLAMIVCDDQFKFTVSKTVCRGIHCDDYTQCSFTNPNLPYVVYIDTRLDYITFIYKDKFVKVYNDLNVCVIKNNQIQDYFIPKFNNQTLSNLESKFKDIDEELIEFTKNLNIPSFDLENKFTEDTKVDTNDPEYKLGKLIGLNSAKIQLRRFKNHLLKNKNTKINLNMVFSGNPGTGKTTVARLVGEILYKNNILPKNKFTECSREGLIANYVGQTADKTRKVLTDALGGVLFIDEAYSLIPTWEGDFANECIAELIQFLEEHKGEICVIMAGYTKEMEKLFESNPGFYSRVPKTIFFEDYNDQELSLILDKMLKDQNYIMELDCKNKFLDIVSAKRNKPNFANAREIRNLLEQLKMIQAERTVDELNNKTITIKDYNIYYNDNKPMNKIKMVSKCNLFDFDSFYNNQYKQTIDTSIEYQQEAIILIYVYCVDGQSRGSGFLVTDDGYAITCQHVVEGAVSIKARRRIRDRHNNWIDSYYDCKLAYVDDKLDFAVIKLDNKYENKFPYLRLDLNERNLVNEYGYDLGYPKSTLFDQLCICDCKFVSHIKQDGQLYYLCDLTTTNGASGSCIISKNTNKVVGILLASLADLLIKILDINTIVNKLKRVSGGDKHE